MPTSTYLSWHLHHKDAPTSGRIRINSQNFNTWATAIIGIDEHEMTLFVHSAEATRELASKLAELSHRLFATANEMDIANNARQQSGLVG
jgi:hypothetical protein